MKTTTVTALTSILTLVSAHGYFQSPKGRQPGEVFKSACGEQAYNMVMIPSALSTLVDLPY